MDNIKHHLILWAPDYSLHTTENQCGDHAVPVVPKQHYDELKAELEMIKEAVNFQAKDGSIWTKATTIGEAYVQQSLRWLHRVIEENDKDSLQKIFEQIVDNY